MIVPTLGTRVDFLERNLQSIVTQSVHVDIVVVCPPDAKSARTLATRFDAQLLDDTGSLPGAINAGARLANESHEFVSWLGDDDMLAQDSLVTTTRMLDAHPQAVLAYGACQYINEHGELLWTSRAGAWAERILSWGPDLIPQPGKLVRTWAWQAVGGVDESLTMAFDLDLLLKLRSKGPFVHTRRVVSCFRWHGDSLTASNRSRNLDESEAVKRRYLTPEVRRVSWLWEKPVRWATTLAAQEVHRRRRARSQVT
jgi:GT2 family glycosyltransferase